MSKIHLEDGTGGGGRETWARIAEIALERAERENRLTWCHEIDQLSARVMATTEPDLIRQRLERLITACQLWQKDIEGRKE